MQSPKGERVAFRIELAPSVRTRGVEPQVNDSQFVARLSTLVDAVLFSSAVRRSGKFPACLWSRSAPTLFLAHLPGRAVSLSLVSACFSVSLLVPALLFAWRCDPARSASPREDALREKGTTVDLSRDLHFSESSGWGMSIL